ncbi:MAG: ABC transporter ATP-binding protein [Rhizobiaceae bacterium]
MKTMSALKRHAELLDGRRQAQGLEADEFQELLETFHEIADLAAKQKHPRDECEALANLCLFLAAEKPEEVVVLAERFFALSLASNDWLNMNVENALSVAYNRLSDEISARQHRARAIEISKNVQNSEDYDYATVLFRNLHAAFQYANTQLPQSERYAISLRDQSLSEWLSDRAQISTTDVQPTFGQFVTNDRQFYRTAIDKVDILSNRLRNNIARPENYLLIANPGAGKSFFVRQFRRELEKTVGEIEFLERNMSAYSSVDQAFSDIVIDVMIALMAHRPTLLFIDEVDTELDGKNMFHRLIAPMNGDPFFFAQKQISFSKQNLVIFYALSSGVDELKRTQKWPDFLSRIPSAHQITLPNFDSALERIYRTISILPVGMYSCRRVEAAALLYIGLREWASSRELEQTLQLAKERITGDPRILRLKNMASSWQDIEAVSEEIFKGPTNILEIVDEAS